MGLLGLRLIAQAPVGWQLTTLLHRAEAPEALGGRVRTIHGVDIADRAAVRAAFREARPDVVIHAASIGNLERCEVDPALCRRINVEGTRHMLEAAREQGSRFLFLSTIYVFDGEHPPYAEQDPVAPLNVYARCKVAAEALVMAEGIRPVILRPQTLYGWHHPTQRPSVVTWLLERLEAGQPSKLVDNVYNNFLWVGDAVTALIRAVEREAEGIFHLGGPESTSRYEFSRTVVDVFGYDPALISPVGRDFFDLKARRPRITSTDFGRAASLLGLEPASIRDGLEQMKRSSPSWRKSFPGTLAAMS